MAETELVNEAGVSVFRGTQRPPGGGSLPQTLGDAALTNRTLSTIGYPYYLAATPDGAKLYCPDVNGNTVTVLDQATLAVLATITVGTTPTSCAITPNGAKCYVMNAGDSTVSVIDTATDTVIATVPVGVLTYNRIATNGVKVYIPDASGATTTVAVMLVADDSLASPIDLGGTPGDVTSNTAAFTPDGTKAYVTLGDGTVTVIDPADDTISGSFATEPPSGSLPVAFSPDGAKGYVGAGESVYPVDVSSDTPGSPIDFTDHPPADIAFTPDGSTAWVSDQQGPGGTLLSIVTADDSLGPTIAVAGYDDQALCITSKGFGYVGTNNTLGPNISLSEFARPAYGGLS